VPYCERLEASSIQVLLVVILVMPPALPPFTAPLRLSIPVLPAPGSRTIGVGGGIVDRPRHNIGRLLGIVDNRRLRGIVRYRGRWRNIDHEGPAG